MEVLSGSVDRITYYNPENGYSVLRLQVEQGSRILTDQQGVATVTGNLPEITPGEYLRLKGVWVNHPKHGWQFQVEVCELSVPATVSGIKRYLGSGLIKGIGPRLAEKIVARFGEHTLEVIEQKPQLLIEVTDIGSKRISMISRAWEEQRLVKDIMLFLHSHGISTNLAVRIYKQYGDQAINVVTSDPYRLATDIYGIGFKTADKIAQALGLPKDHPTRIEAGLLYSIEAMVQEGHVYIPEQVLISKSQKILEVSNDIIPIALQTLKAEKRVVIDPLPLAQVSIPKNTTAKEIESAVCDVCYLPSMYYSEVGVAAKLKELSYALPSRLSDLPPMFTAVDHQLSSEQQNAIHMVLKHPLSVLTGGPGTGKTTCLKSLIDIMDRNHKRYALASPTGRAAKRLSEATGKHASTIHRLLGYSPAEGFKHNEAHPLDIDLLVLDETSMLDINLAFHLLKAIKPGTHLLFVGDVDQLPSVGAGDFLRDLISAAIIPVNRLEHIYRQEHGSQIISNAHRINHGQYPLFPKVSGDFYLFPAETPEEASQWLQQVVCERIPHKFNLNPHDDIQVLAPMYRGAAGVNSLNQSLQMLLNPPNPSKSEKDLYGQLFRAGDKVMQIRNNYEKDVYNGDIGRVQKIDLTEHILFVDFDGKPTEYDWSEVDQLVLAYAISVHKAQGSEFPAVVIPIITAHYMMLQRNLLYTAITRARQLCVLVGSKKAIHIAVRNDQVAKRYTALAWRLK